MVISAPNLLTSPRQYCQIALWIQARSKDTALTPSLVRYFNL